jgi:HNH endonuclease
MSTFSLRAPDVIVEVPLSHETRLKDGTKVSTMQIRACDLRRLRALNNGLPGSWKRVAIQETRGILNHCQWRVSRSAVGLLAPYRGKMKRVHHLVALVTGLALPGTAYGTGRGGLTIDHKDENPANNVPANLRVMRHELNSTRQAKSGSVSKMTSGTRWAFRKPLFTYISPNEALRQRAGHDRRLKKLRYTKGTDADSTASSRHKAERRLRKTRRAVLLFLRGHDAELFLGRAWCPVRKEGIEVDFFAEIKADF